MKIAVIGDDEFVLGFQLAGVKIARICSTAEDALNALTELHEKDNLAILIIQKKFSSKLAGEIKRLKSQKTIYPVIIELPGYAEEETVEDPMREIIRRAIGVDIMKR